MATISEVFEIARAHHAVGRLADAEALYRRILGLDRTHIGSNLMLAAIGHQTGHYAEALVLIDRALAVDPAQPATRYGRAMALQSLGRYEEAVVEYQQAIALKPDYVEASHNLAALFQMTGRADEAISAYRRVLALKPDYVDAHNNLGVALRDKFRFVEAVACFETALKLAPAHAELHNNLAVVLKAQGRLDEAVLHYQQALALKPEYVGAHSNILMSLNYRPGLGADEIYRAHCEWDARHGRKRAPAEPVRPLDRSPDRPLRVGYVSPDFREHSVAYFFEPVLARHDPRMVETFCYANVPKPDAVTARLQSHARHWRQIDRLDEAAIAGQIRADGIDILVDLAGHSSNHSLCVFARKPAPLQVTWLGYPNTTGLAAIDYRLTDEIADPPGAAAKLHTERLEYLPQGFLCYQPVASAPPVGRLPADLSGTITFGSFNNLAKVTPQVVAVWAEILRTVPNSRLVLKSSAFADAATGRLYTERFAAEGVARERLDLLPHDTATAAHLAHYHMLDIALDPFPYSGTTTTCEALWMGVPVVTLAGNRHAARVGASLLTRLGLEALVTHDEAGYVAAANRLARDLPALASLRAGLRARLMRSPLCDADGFARQLEAAYRRMWRRYLGETAA
ncbi:MAG: tetratricopeptide repeat protein [Aliidongia sp.]